MKTVFKIILGIIGAFIIMGMLFVGCTALVVNEADKEMNSSESSSSDSKDSKEDSDVPREHKNALASAESYQSTMPMSKEGLREQLSSEAGDSYPEDAVNYALENIDTDYKESALKSAKSYQDTMPMSDDELFEQLTSQAGDKYTQEEAQYAIDNLN